MPEQTSADRTFTFCLRAGDMLLSNGSPSANVSQAMLAVARTSGFPDATVNVTMGQIVLSYSPTADSTPVTRVKNIGTPGLDVHTLTVLEHIVEDVVTSRIDSTTGLERLEALADSPPQRPVWSFTGTASMGAGFAWLLGGRLSECFIAASCAVIIEIVTTLTTRIQLPSYYSRAFASALAVVAAALATSLWSLGAPGLIITAALVTQLAGSASVSAVQDLLTGWMLTASGRILESLLMTTGLAVGALGAVMGVQNLGIHLNIEQTEAGNPSGWQTTCAAAIITAGFALMSHTRWHHLPLLITFGALGHLAYLAADSLGLSPFTSTGLAAALLGILTVLCARPARLPTSGSLDISITPLVPGMALYKGLAGVASHDGAAPQELWNAGTVALAIGTGAVFGQFVASRVLWSTKSLQYRQAFRRGDEDLDDAQFAAQGLSTPDFRRPFTDGGQQNPQA